MNSNYQTIFETGNADPQWDDFLSQIDGAHHEQSTCWARVKAHQGWQAIRIRVLKGSDWLAGAQILCKKLPFGGSVGYISCGPFYTVPDPEALDVLIRAINQLASKKRIQYIAITPYVENKILDKVLMKHGYRPTQETLPPTTTTTATLILDLSQDFDKLLMKMREDIRKKIRRSSKSGLSVREGEKKDLVDLFRLMTIVCKRRGETPVPNSLDSFEYIWNYYHSQNYVRLLIVELEGEMISAQIFFTFGNTVRIWKYGWSGKEEKKYPNHLLHWYLIRWAKNNGFRYFDFVQVDSVVTDHLAAHLPETEELKARRLYGSTLFKAGFGGQVVKFSGPWFRFQNPLIRFLYRQFGSSLMRTKYAKKMISRLS